MQSTSAQVMTIDNVNSLKTKEIKYFLFQVWFNQYLPWSLKALQNFTETIVYSVFFYISHIKCKVFHKAWYKYFLMLKKNNHS